MKVWVVYTDYYDGYSSPQMVFANKEALLRHYSGENISHEPTGELLIGFDVIAEEIEIQE